MNKVLFCVLMLSLLFPSMAWSAQYQCSLYAQNPQRIQVIKGQTINREVEIVFTNTGQSTWQNIGGVTNGNYIELRPVNSTGQEIEGPLYDQTWINRKRVGSYLANQRNVIQGYRARFVFRINLDTSSLTPGTYRYYFRPYHAFGHWIQDWGNCHIQVDVQNQGSNPSPPQLTPVSTIHGASMNPVIEGTLVTIIGSATNNAIEYEWQNNGSTLSNQASFERSFNVGSHQLSLRARNSYGWGQKTFYTLNVQTSSAPPSAQAHIQHISIERTNPNTGFPENYDMVLHGAIPIRQYRILHLQGSSNAQVSGYEWSIHHQGQVSIIGTQASISTSPTDLPKGMIEIGFRVLDPLGRWSDYARFPLEVQFWPRLRFPVNGDWRRSGNNYFQGDHRGISAQYAEDYNQASGSARADFGREIVAALQGFVETTTYSDGGKAINIISEDHKLGVKFRARYMHLTSFLVNNGDRVIQGQPIGLCGNTGDKSQGSHLHYVLQIWRNNQWESVIPEPIWINESTVLQTTRYDAPLNIQNRSIPDWIIILPEVFTGQGSQDPYGWNGSKIWSETTPNQDPTVSVYWETTVQKSGQWQLLMHNPSGFTQSSSGIPTHNTTTNAVFEIMRTGSAGTETYHVNQSANPKGALIEITTLDLQAGDRLMITQHNATGESNLEISFDELVLRLVQNQDSGGSIDLSPDNHTNANSSPPATSGRGGSGGGCQIASTTGTTSLWPVFLLLGMIVFRLKSR